MRFAPVLLIPSILCAQTSQPVKTTFEEQPALLVTNSTLELTVLPRGGTFASLVLMDDPEKLSPLWNPIRLAREAGEKNTFESSQGHFICVDGFGPVSKEEEAAGLQGHGEAHERPFDVKFYAKQGSVTTLTIATKLPLAQELFERTVRMAEG